MTFQHPAMQAHTFGPNSMHCVVCLQRAVDIVRYNIQCKSDGKLGAVLAEVTKHAGFHALMVSPTTQRAKDQYRDFMSMVRGLHLYGQLDTASGLAFYPYQVRFLNGSSVMFVGSDYSKDRLMGYRFDQIVGTDDPWIRSREYPYDRHTKVTFDQVCPFKDSDHQAILNRLRAKMQAGLDAQRITEDTTVPELTKEQIKKNKFYVGSPKAILDSWGHADLAAATDHAKERLDATGGTPQFVVKIVRVVRRKSPPIAVEDIK